MKRKHITKQEVDAARAGQIEQVLFSLQVMPHMIKEIERLAKQGDIVSLEVLKRLEENPLDSKPSKEIEILKELFKET